MDFEKFWKMYKKKIRKRDEKEFLKKLEQELGEWALKELKKELIFTIRIINWDIFSVKKRLELLDNLCAKRKILYGIASACLGKRNTLKKLLKD